MDFFILELCAKVCGADIIGEAVQIFFEDNLFVIDSKIVVLVDKW